MDVMVTPKRLAGDYLEDKATKLNGELILSALDVIYSRNGRNRPAEEYKQ